MTLQPGHRGWEMNAGRNPEFRKMDPISTGIGLLAGTALAFLLFRAFYRGRYVTRVEHDSLRQVHATTQADRQAAQERLDARESTVRDLQARLAQAETERLEWMRQGAALEATLDNQSRQLREHADHLARERETNRMQQSELREQHGQLARMKAEHDALALRLSEQRAELESLQKQMRLEFEQLAHKIFAEKTRSFSEMSKTSLESLLKPLGENLEGFRRKVEETYDKESKERFSLEAKVKDLIQHTERISQEANNLAAALKGQAKTRGDWGETILERILEQSGLTRDREYFLQETLHSEEGQVLRPDVVVRLPDNRHVVIDSKVSLIAYVQYTEADSDAAREDALAAHLRSMRTHVDQLSGKKYETLADSLDFVIMFVPVEPAYLAAIQSDPDLWAYAYARRILLISPTNLIAVLKIVADLWKREQQSRNALEIARQGERLLDKFLGFVSSMEDVGKHLDKSHEAYEKAMKQLRDGRGNLTDQAFRLKSLGIKSAKATPPSIRHLDIPETPEEADTDPDE